MSPVDILSDALNFIGRYCSLGVSFLHYRKRRALPRDKRLGEFYSSTPLIEPSPSGDSMSSPRIPEEGLTSLGGGQRNHLVTRLRKKLWPHLHKRPQGGRSMVYLVDDDVNDTIGSQDYFEGYQDALREMLADEDSNIEEPSESPAVGGLEASEDADSALVHSNSLSLNLQQRQQAINSTHPFGIKIWKPSVYKKNRLVAQRADEDIHDYQHRPGRITWMVTLTNFIWMFTVGILLGGLCTVGAFIVLLCSAGSSLCWPYVTLLIKLGGYFLWPFGKFVLLKRDKNYLDEDQLDGRLISEFHQWRLQEEGRLFYAPPRRQTDGLLKDHKGRSLQELFSAQGPSTQQNADHQQTSDDEDNETDFKLRWFGRGLWLVGRFAFYLFFYLILQPCLYLVLLICWLVVFTIPMANITNTLCDHLRRHPLALDFEPEALFYQHRTPKNQRLLMCTYKCCGLHYYKYTIDGTNIFFINLIPVVIFVILDFFVLKEKLHWKTWYTDANFIFCACLFSIIPLAYFIGQAVASISAQSLMGVGAVINAFFSTVVEIFLYCVALNQGKGKLVEGSMIGLILGGVCLLPGLSMCGGALKRKTQRYNPRSAGVLSTMLLFAMVIMFAPSLFYQIYGTYELRCKSCVGFMAESPDCKKCRFIQPLFTLDKLYYKVLRPFLLIVATALFLAYVCGLYFTLKSHALLIWATSHDKKDDVGATPMLPPQVGSTREVRVNKQLPPLASFTGSSQRVPTTLANQTTAAVSSNEDPNTSQILEIEEGEGGHDAPNWSKTKSTVILLLATLLYAIIAEILVDTVDLVLSDYPIDPKFLGLTVFALVPNTTEFLNAISFAVGGNVALLMEIGLAYALQVVLIQIPALVMYLVYENFDSVDQIFSLVFPRWDIIATLILIYLFTYIYAEGKSNYFKGFILILVYIVVLIGFYFNDLLESVDDGYMALAELFDLSQSFVIG